MPLDQQHRGRALRQRFSCARGPATRRCDARGGRRNRRRPGRHRSAAGAQAHGGAEVHQGLRVGFDVARRQQRLGARPERALDRRRRQASRRCRAWRASTRLTLPSRIAPRVPNANAAIAAAVERPMPGSAAIAAASRGKTPPCSRDDRLRGAMQQMRAPVVAQSRSTARARARPAPRQALATSGNAAMKRS